MWYDLSWTKEELKMNHELNKMTKIWNLAKKCKIHIPERAVEWNTKHKHLTKQILNSSKTNHTIAKKKNKT